MSEVSDKLDTHALAVFLDVDGTLLDIRETPGQVRADDSLVRLLQACHVAVDGALALVSGRTIAELDRIFSPAIFPAAGAHGAEIRTSAGGGVTTRTAAVPDPALRELRDFADSNEGLLLENKRGGVSLHYRRAPELESACRRQVNAVLSQLGDSYRLIAGKMVFEIAPVGCHKGTAIAAMLDLAPFAGRRPVFIGDDVTDEDGFRVVNELDGTSIRVGDIGRSSAQASLPDVGAVRRWLSEALAGQKKRQSEEAAS